MIKEFTTYIANQTSLTIGTDLFAGQIPPSNTGTSVVVESRDPGFRDPHPGNSDMGQTPYRIVVRGAVGEGWHTTRTTAYTVFDALHAKTQVSLPVVDTTTYLVNIDCSEPYSLGEDENGATLFIIRAVVTKEEN